MCALIFARRSGVILALMDALIFARTSGVQPALIFKCYPVAPCAKVAIWIYNVSLDVPAEVHPVSFSSVCGRVCCTAADATTNVATNAAADT